MSEGTRPHQHLPQFVTAHVLIVTTQEAERHERDHKPVFAQVFIDPDDPAAVNRKVRRVAADPRNALVAAQVGAAVMN